MSLYCKYILQSRWAIRSSHVRDNEIISQFIFQT